MKHRQKTYKKNEALKYTSDGIGIDILGIFKEKFDQCECCQKFYRSNAFEHQQNGYYIEGIDACIHCYICLNLDKYNSTNNANNANNALSVGEKKILSDYLSVYSQEHCSTTCCNTKTYGKCLLCEYLAMQVNNSSSHQPKKNNETNFVSDDGKIMIARYKKPDFVLQI